MALKDVSLGQKVVFLGSVAPTAPTLGPNSMTFKNTFTGSSFLNSNSLNIPAGSFVFSVVGMGALANVHATTDSVGNDYEALLPPHAYINWWGSGQQVFVASDAIGGSSVVLTETMPDTNDEVTLSVVVVVGSTITNAIASETTPGPVTSASVTVSGPAVLLCWWWGDGAIVQESADPSVGWTIVHELDFAQASGGVLQVCLASRVVSVAGTYDCTWVANDGQGAVTYIVSVE